MLFALTLPMLAGPPIALFALNLDLYIQNKERQVMNSINPTTLNL